MQHAVPYSFDPDASLADIENIIISMIGAAQVPGPGNPGTEASPSTAQVESNQERERRGFAGAGAATSYPPHIAASNMSSPHGIAYQIPSGSSTCLCDERELQTAEGSGSIGPKEARRDLDLSIGAEGEGASRPCVFSWNVFPEDVFPDDVFPRAHAYAPRQSPSSIALEARLCLLAAMLASCHRHYAEREQNQTEQQ